MESKANVQSCLLSAYLTAGSVVVPTIRASAGGNEKNPGNISPNAKFHGLAYGEWQARWWQLALSLPASDHPFNLDIDCAKEKTDTLSELTAEIYGVSVQNLPAYRHQSPVYTFGPLPEDNLLGLPPGTTAQSVDDGYYLLLAPPSVGEHTIHFMSAFEGERIIDAAYRITVSNM
jgi:hypothetical protein